MDSPLLHPITPVFLLEQAEQSHSGGEFEAAALFVDISGFTNLMDAVATHDAEGAEVLANVMRAVFQPLMQAVFARGGYVATQAGDSFMALFPLADAHDLGGLRRALAAAWQIQQLSAANLRRQTPYGDFEIQVKVGLACGAVEWGILQAQGGERSLGYFRGPAVDDCAAAEHQAAPGDVILHPSIYRMLQNECTAEAYQTVYRLLAPSAELLAQSPAGAIPPQRRSPAGASRFAPLELLQSSQAGEFRQVTHLFVGVTPELAQNQLPELMQVVFELQARYGGHIELLFGDKGAHLLVIWGAPRAYENDIQRALKFCLELRGRYPQQLTCSLTRRLAHVGFIGCELAEQYAAYGRGINLAARFLTSASLGSVWVDEGIARRVAGQFEFEPLGALSFKGFNQPQPVYRLIGQIAGRQDSAETFFGGQMVGRQADLETLSAFIQPIYRQQFAGMLVVWGEPGIGKSRLVHHFLESLPPLPGRPLQIFIAQTDEILRLPFNPFRYWLRYYFDQVGQVDTSDKLSCFEAVWQALLESLSDAALRERLLEARPALLTLLSLETEDSEFNRLDARVRHELTQSGLESLFIAESLRGPLIFFLEDVHWLDVESKAFLARLLARLQPAQPFAKPVAILATARYQGAGLPLNFPYQEIYLGSLAADELTELAAEVLGGPATPELLAQLAQRSDGNPFFAEQILRHARENGLLQSSPTGWRTNPRGSGLPGDVQSLLIARLDRLADEVRGIVQAAAVLGREFEVQLLQQMLQDGNLSHKVWQAEQAAIWTALTEMRYIFRHALMREAAYEMQVQARRRQLHALALQAGEQLYKNNLRPHYGELGYHAEQAGQKAPALHYLSLAAQTAAEDYQNQAALEYYSRALALAEPGEVQQRFELLYQRCELLDLTADRPAQYQAIQALQALAAQLSLAEQARAAGSEMRYLMSTDAAEETQLTVMQQVIDLGHQAGRLDSEAEGYIMLGLHHIFATRYDQGRELVQQGLALARQAGNLPLEARALRGLGHERGLRGDYPPQLEYYQQALAVAQRTGSLLYQAGALSNLSVVYNNMLEIEKAFGIVQQAAAINRKTGDLAGLSIDLHNMAHDYFVLGQIDLALAYLAESEALTELTQQPSSFAYCLWWRGEIYLYQSRQTEAIESLQRSLALMLSSGEVYFVPAVSLALGRAWLEAGDYPAARTQLIKTLEWSEQGVNSDHAAVPAYLILTELALGETAQAAAWLDKLLPLLPDVDVEDAYLAEIWGICRALHAMQRPEAADLHQRARQQLLAVAEKIQNPAYRQGYLSHAAHQALLNA